MDANKKKLVDFPRVVRYVNSCPPKINGRLLTPARVSENLLESLSAHQITMEKIHHWNLTDIVVYGYKKDIEDIYMYMYKQYIVLFYVWLYPMLSIV